MLGAPRGTADNQVGLDEQIFASQALLYKCRRRRAPINGDDVGCLLRLALGFTGRGLRAVLIQVRVGRGFGGCLPPAALLLFNVRRKRRSDCVGGDRGTAVYSVVVWSSSKRGLWVGGLS